VGLYLLAAMNAYAIWRFAGGLRVSEPWLYYSGIVAGIIGSAGYLHLGRRWFVAREGHAGAPTASDDAPIEPS
jgi:hypothetical protein